MAPSKFFRERNIKKKIRTIKDKTVFSYKRFDLIKVYFSVRYSVRVYVYFINCFNAKLYRETLPVAPTVRFTASVTATHFSISACETYSRLSVKWSPTGG